MLFIIIFLTIYFFINFYFFYKIKHFLNIKSKYIYIFPVLMTLSPVFYRFYDKAGFDNFYLSFFILWYMGFVILFGIYYFFIDFYHFLLKIIHKIVGHNPLPHISIKKGFIFVFALSILSTAYGYYETLNLQVYRFIIYSDKVEKDFKILHISDLHLNQVMREDKIKKIIEIYEKEKPDIVISTGDLVDGNVKNKISYINLLRKINPPLGKYAILGNHEYYADVEQAIDFTQKSGFLLLRDSFIYLPYNVAIVGVDDIEAERFGILRKYNDLEILNKVDKDKFIIFLKHQPKIDKNIIGKFDLALCGHTHGGVIFPVKYILRKIFITDAGFLKGGNSYIFVSRGVGTGAAPLRIGALPDVAIFEIKKK
ncbi:metallophosphoesterase [Venenivibrio stagnispumantis]|uniref:Calcineurin-like phosphoesterase domain-containing protein n=2 Tax=Venenivibrio stagnispumantis TaxID=407998 RepID=A0AA45WJC2_9AQUI|nr:metallophosphoesterase [Venenivibrio stagnispumantis]SMP02898.1 hypothetical protein SAMN06264868_102102 [Venenivibrio stagnispumantis]